MPFSNAQRIDPSLAHRRIRFLWVGAAAMTATAGYVNSVLLSFFETPVSHMTGAISHLGLHLVRDRGHDAWVSLSIVLGFLAGAMLAGVIVGALRLLPSRSYGVVMMVEGGLLALATALLFTKQRLGFSVVAMACGLQNATTSSYCGLMIRTTHVTGTMTDLGMIFGHWLRHGRIEWWRFRFLSLLLLSFFAGGIAGTFAVLRFGPGCLAVAATGITLAGGAFWVTTHRGLVNLMQESSRTPPRTGAFPLS